MFRRKRHISSKKLPGSYVIGDDKNIMPIAVY
jgi:hypothetical protein